MKTMLIYPGISGIGFNSFKRDNFVHHGLASIASYLTTKHHEVEYVDLRRLNDWKEFRKIIKNTDSKVIGITSTTVHFGYAIKCASIIKKLRPEIVVVSGGVHTTICPEDPLKVKYFDYIVTGEGEIVFEKLLNSIKNKKKTKRLISGEPCPLDSLKIIDRDLFNFSEGEMLAPIVADLPVPFATVLSSRGCPYNCAFCQPAERMITGGVVRMRSIDNFIEELIYLKKKYKLKSFLVHDDLFTVSRDRMLEFAKKYKKAKINLPFMCQARADLIVRNEDVFKKLASVGLKVVMIGFESGSQRVLDFMNKNTTVEQNLKAAEVCKKCGIEIWANYMFAVPTETLKEMINTLRMIKKINPKHYSPALFTPYPGTKLYDYCLKHNLLLIKRKKYDKYQRGLVGDKIKGFNYNLIRFLIAWYMPLRYKWYFYYFLTSLFKSEPV